MVTELEDLLIDVLNQACQIDTGELDSMAISAYADGLRYLAKIGVFEIKVDRGKRVIGHVVEG